MAQRTSGIYGILSFSWAFDLFQKMIGADKFRKIFVNNYLKPQKDEMVLDIGCGPGLFYKYMPQVKFTGYDLNPLYIESAKKAYGDVAEFYTGDVSELELSDEKKFDLVFSVGVMHHLDDDHAMNLVKIAHSVLKPGGRFVTVDPAYSDDQSSFARFMINRDRGLSVRYEKEALKLYKDLFPNVKSTVIHNLLRMPYTHLIVEATRE